VNVFNKLADLIVIGAEGAINILSIQAKIHLFGGKLAADLVVELKESQFPETVKELKAPIMAAMVANAEAKSEASKSWSELSKELKKSFGVVGKSKAGKFKRKLKVVKAVYGDRN
jgi:hypothetical protein